MIKYLSKERKNTLFTNIIYLLVFIIVAAVAWLLIWRLGILKKEPVISEEVAKIQSRIKYIETYQIRSEAENLMRLVPPAQTLEIATITLPEVGKRTIFE